MKKLFASTAVALSLIAGSTHAVDSLYGFYTPWDNPYLKEWINEDNFDCSYVPRDGELVFAFGAKGHVYRGVLQEFPRRSHHKLSFQILQKDIGGPVFSEDTGKMIGVMYRLSLPGSPLWTIFIPLSRSGFC